MKTNSITITLAAAICFGTLPLAAQTQRQLPSGLGFRVPAGWTANLTQDAASLVAPNHSQDNELYAVAPLPGVRDLNDPQLTPLLKGEFSEGGVTATALGQPVAFQAAGGPGKVFAYQVTSATEQGRFLFFVVGLRGGGVALLLAAGKAELLAARQTALVEVASSLEQHAGAAPAPATTGGSLLTRQWTQRLSDKKLVSMSSYNSGYGGGGYSSEKKLYLASNGSYAFRSSSSVSVYVPGATGGSAGRNAQEGRWRVVEQSGQPMLELAAQDGNREVIRLAMEGTKTFLNGNRWFVVGINE